MWKRLQLMVLQVWRDSAVEVAAADAHDAACGGVSAWKTSRQMLIVRSLPGFLWRLLQLMLMMPCLQRLYAVDAHDANRCS